MHKLTLLRAGGSHRAFGLALGRFGKAALPDLMATIAWKNVTEQAKSPLVLAMAERTRTLLPAIWDEIGGMAEGLGLPLDEVFAWNCRGDLWAAAEVDGCTTVMMPGDRAVLAHNEDGLAALSPHCGLVEASPQGAPGFVSFLYPASIPGHSFTVNATGLTITVNHIQPAGIGEGLPRMVVCRALLEAGRTGQALAMLRRLPRAGGFHLTLAQPGEAEMQSVEFTGDSVSVQAKNDPSAHTNHMIHPGLAERAQNTTDSSASRQARAEALLGQEPLAILRDTAIADLPILCRGNGDPNTQITLAQVRFTLGERDGVEGDVFLPGAPAPEFHVTADPAAGSVKATRTT